METAGLRGLLGDGETRGKRKRWLRHCLHLFLASKMSAGNPYSNILPKSMLSSLKNPDYSPWQRKARKQTPRLDLPPLNRSEEKKEGRNKSVSERSPVFGLKMPLPVKQRVHFSQAMAKEMKLAKSLENIKILQRISKSRRHSLDELKHHSKVLLKKNLGLMEWIKEMDYESAKDARDLLQQYEMFGTVITTLRDSTQNQVGIAKRELMEKEKIVEKNMGKLDAEMGRMNTKVQSLQDELNVLRSYMDKEYPVKAVQISSLMRSIRNLIEEQQYP
nr:uncharacterized protein C20orf96-like [Anolis sagrei ordinatus]